MPSLSVFGASKIDFLKKRFIRFYSVLTPAIIAVVLLNYINHGRGPSPVNVHSAIQIVGAFFAFSSLLDKICLGFSSTLEPICRVICKSSGCNILSKKAESSIINLSGCAPICIWNFLCP